MFVQYLRFLMSNSFNSLQGIYDPFSSQCPRTVPLINLRCTRDPCSPAPRLKVYNPSPAISPGVFIRVGTYGQVLPAIRISRSIRTRGTRLKWVPVASNAVKNYDCKCPWVPVMLIIGCIKLFDAHRKRLSGDLPLYHSLHLPVRCILSVPSGRTSRSFDLLLSFGRPFFQKYSVFKTCSRSFSSARPETYPRQCLPHEMLNWEQP